MSGTRAKFTPSHAAISCLVTLLLVIADYACVLPQMEDGEVELCEHRGWPGPEDDWSQYEIQSAPFVKADNSLLKPPVVQMLVENGEIETFTDGKLFTAHWVNKYTRLELDQTLPVPWPDPTSGRFPCHVRMLTDKLPWSVTIVGLSSADVDVVTGEPLTDGIRYECGRFGHRPCVHLNDEGFVEIHPIPQPLLDLPYLVVFAMWMIHPYERTGQPEDPPSMFATWLFRFSEE